MTNLNFYCLDCGTEYIEPVYFKSCKKCFANYKQGKKYDKCQRCKEEKEPSRFGLCTKCYDYIKSLNEERKKYFYR